MSNYDFLSDYINKQILEGENLLRFDAEVNNKELHPSKTFYKIKERVDNFIEGDIANRLVIMPGLRGVGKTTVLYNLYSYLVNEKNIEKDRVLYLTGDHLTNFVNENMFNVVEQFVERNHRESLSNLTKKIFILFDEAQYDEKWGVGSKVLYDRGKNIFLLVTGSSALDLELNADISRRTIMQKAFPLNFSEYLMINEGFEIDSSISEDLEELFLTGNVENSLFSEQKLFSNLAYLNEPLDILWNKYLCFGDLPISVNLSEVDTLHKVHGTVKKVIDDDLSHFKSIRNGTKGYASLLLFFLATMKPGEVSENKLAKNLEISSSLVKDLLGLFEKTTLIFSVQPYGKAKKPWKYYFASVCTKSAIAHGNGRYYPKDSEFLRALAENLVASKLHQLAVEKSLGLNLFYPSGKGEVDFLLVTKDKKRIIPVEVGYGKKSKRQIMNAIRKYKSSYGIVISNTTSRIKKEENVIYIPLKTFSFI